MQWRNSTDRYGRLSIGESKNVAEFMKEVSPWDRLHVVYFSIGFLSMPPQPCFITIFYTMAHFGR